MQIQSFIGNIDYYNIQFSFYLAQKVQSKISQKKLFYKEQVWDYISKKIETYLRSLAVKPSLLSVYKSELLTLLKQKIDPIIEKHNLFSCK